MRIRTVKPEFWSHPILSAQDPVIRLGAIGLLNLADDGGYFMATPALVRSALFPLDECSTNARRVLATLSSVGYIETRSHPTHGDVGMVVNFNKHQRIDRPSPSKIKDYFDSANVRRTLDDHSLLYQGSGDQGSRDQGNEGAGGVGDSALPPQSPPAPRSKRFIPPTVADVEAYALAAGHSIDAVKFVAHYESVDWVRGKTKISNWKMAVVTWTRNNFDKAKGGSTVQLEGAFVQAHNFDEAYAAIDAGERMHNEAAKERAAKQEQSK